MNTLLIPGLGCTARVFAGQIEALERLGPVQIADTRTGSTVREMAASILRDAPPRFAMCGFSMGGYVAFEILRQVPERVEKLVLLDTRADADSPADAVERRRKIALARAGKLELALRGPRPSPPADARSASDAAIRLLHLEMTRENGALVYASQQEAILSRPDSRPDLADIAAPTLIIVGERDEVTPPAAAHEMAALIANSQLVVIERAGHFALLEAAGAVSDAMVAFLAG